jgi:hypothetical protein
MRERFDPGIMEQILAAMQDFRRAPIKEEVEDEEEEGRRTLTTDQ